MTEKTIPQEMLQSFLDAGFTPPSPTNHEPDIILTKRLKLKDLISFNKDIIDDDMFFGDDSVIVALHKDYKLKFVVINQFYIYDDWYDWETERTGWKILANEFGVNFNESN